MLKKTRSGESKARVTFVLPAQAHADHVHVAGDFNGWQATTPMKRQKDGSWRATVELEPGREYQFRYLVDGNVWVNDEAADAYVPNPFGADNCVVRTPEAAGGTAKSTRSARGRGGSSPAAGTHAARSAGKGAGAKTGGSRTNGKGAGRARPGGAKPTEPPQGG